MTQRLEELLKELRKLESELLSAIESRSSHYSSEAIKRGIRFTDEMIAPQRQQAIRIRDYLRGARLANVATTPVIWLNLIPALLLDIMVSCFQYSCFPVYGIPRVKRSDYVVDDRHNLDYLNSIEKINCAYCGYFNGVIAYTQEVAARTEQYWCPIKHAQMLKTEHSRYSKFSDFDDSEQFRQGLEEIRQQFDDIKPPD